jgi:gluconolactonase
MTKPALLVLPIGFFGFAVGVLNAMNPTSQAPPPPSPPRAEAVKALRIERLDPSLDSLIAPDAKIEILADGYDWSEGPVWIKDGGFLLFSDVPQNVIHRWKQGEGAKPFLKPSGYTGTVPRGGEMGSNGLTLDSSGRLVICQHGDRRVARMDAPFTAPKPTFTTLADKFDGKRFNSPNDVIFHSNGDMYFTDPPYGMEKQFEDPKREIPYQGVYRRDRQGTVTLLTRDMTRPNGLAFSPDEKKLYVAQSDPAAAIWRVFDVTPDGSLGANKVLLDVTPMVKTRTGLPDGMKVAANGTLFASGPGGILVISPEGKHLGTIMTGQATANCAFGDDGSTLYMTADMFLMRVRLKTKGRGF